MVYKKYFGSHSKGGIDHGGLDKIIENFHDGERNVWNDFSFDPRYRHTFWSIVLGGVFGTWGNNWCSTQSMVQRMLACRTKNDMRLVFNTPQKIFPRGVNSSEIKNLTRLALYTAWFFICIILVLAGFTGAILYMYNACCDPLRAGYLDSTDQLVPYLAVNLFHDWPGVAGLYIAGAYCGALSTVSSGINSMATVIITDFIKI